MSFDTSSVPSNIQEVDSLLSSIESPDTAQVEETQVEAPVEQAQEVQPQEEAVNADPQYAIKWKGEERTLPLSKILSYAQQAYDYNEKMREYNVNRQMFEKERAQFEGTNKEFQERLKQYQDVENYIKQDPEWWNYVRSNYAQRVSEQGQAPSPLNPVIDGLAKKVETLEQQLTAQQEREKLIAQAQEDEALNAQVQGYKEQYSQFDWTTKNEQGWDLEQQIIDYGIKNHIGSFKAAANDYLFDEHLKRAQLIAKENVAKDIKKVSKLGLGPVKDAPENAIKKIKNPSSMSWDEIGEEALKDLQLA